MPSHPDGRRLGAKWASSTWPQPQGFFSLVAKDGGALWLSAVPTRCAVAGRGETTCESTARKSCRGTVLGMTRHVKVLSWKVLVSTVVTLGLLVSAPAASADSEGAPVNDGPSSGAAAGVTPVEAAAAASARTKLKRIGAKHEAQDRDGFSTKSVDRFWPTFNMGYDPAGVFWQTEDGEPAFTFDFPRSVFAQSAQNWVDNPQGNLGPSFRKALRTSGLTGSDWLPLGDTSPENLEEVFRTTSLGAITVDVATYASKVTSRTTGKRTVFTAEVGDMTWVVTTRSGRIVSITRPYGYGVLSYTSHKPSTSPFGKVTPADTTLVEQGYTFYSRWVAFGGRMQGARPAPKTTYATRAAGVANIQQKIAPLEGSGYEVVNMDWGVKVWARTDQYTADFPDIYSTVRAVAKKDRWTTKYFLSGSSN